MPPQNLAAYLETKQSPTQPVRPAAYNTPLPDEMVIKNAAIAINPADVLIQKLGIIADTFPCILGCDAAGVVVEVGANVTGFEVGDRVIGTCRPRTGGETRNAGFQLDPCLETPRVVKIPQGVSFEEAVVLPLGVYASSACLFHESTLGLGFPPGEGGKGKVLLVWGASGSLGCCGVQLAVNAGYEVFGIASSKNHEYVRGLGAKEMFDYNDPELVGKVVQALEGKECVGAFDAISKDETLHALCEMLSRVEGRKVVAAVAPGAEGKGRHSVVIKSNFGVKDYNTSIGPKIWEGFLEAALVDGRFKCAPPADVVGHGLEDVQKACDVLAKGVSAKKLVVSLDGQ